MRHFRYLIQTLVYGTLLGSLLACGGGGSSGSPGPGNDRLDVPTATLSTLMLGRELTPSEESGINSQSQVPSGRDLDDDPDHRLIRGQFRKNSGLSEVVVAYRDDADVSIAELSRPLDDSDPSTVSQRRDLIRAPTPGQRQRSAFNVDDLGINVETEDTYAFISGNAFAFADVYEFSALGLWVENIDNLITAANYNDDIGFFHLGLRPADGDRPTSGTATYDGFAFGYYDDPGSGNRYFIDVGPAGNTVQFTADFSRNTIGGRIVLNAGGGSLIEFPWDPSSSPAPTPRRANLDIALADTTITGVTFNGDVSVTRADMVLSPLMGATGTYDGSFYGPAGEELGGTLDAGDRSLIMTFWGDNP